MAEVILSHPFGGTKVDLMERDGEDSKGQRKPQGFQLFGRRRRRDTSPLALKQAYFAEMKTGRISKKYSLLLSKANLFCRKETPTDILKKFPLLLEANSFRTNENPTDFQRKHFHLL